MRYPNSTKTFHKKISHANRGMVLEELINESNKHYLENELALIYKKPTPIGIVSVKTENSKKIITKAFFKEPSTLDYSGIYKGKYLEFDAKETHNKTSFPLANISKRQQEHLNKVTKHGGISFLIIAINGEHFILSSNDISLFTNKEKRKSIPLSFIKEKGLKIKSNNYIKLDYLKEIDKIIGGINNEATEKRS